MGILQEPSKDTTEDSKEESKDGTNESKVETEVKQNGISKDSKETGDAKAMEIT